MNVRIWWLAVGTFGACLLISAQSRAQKAYIPNSSDDTVSVIDTTTNTVTATISVPGVGFGVAVTSDGSKVYVASGAGLSVIDTATNTVTATIPAASGDQGLGGVVVTPDGGKVYASLGTGTVSAIDAATEAVTATIAIPSVFGGVGGGMPVAVTPDGSKVYVSSVNDDTVAVIDTAKNVVVSTFFVAEPEGAVVTPDGSKVYIAGFDFVKAIDTATNNVIATIPDEAAAPPIGLAVSPDGSKVYVANADFFGRPLLDSVSVIDTATDTVTATIPVGEEPLGLALTPDGSKVYVASYRAGTVSAIDTATNAVTATIPVGSFPVAFGSFIPTPVPQNAPAAGNLCNGIYKGTFNGNLTVSAGQDCIFLRGRIAGIVNVIGGNFALNGATVGGNVTVNGGATYTLGPAARVGGNLIIQNISPGSADNSVCGTTVYGNMQLDNAGTAVQIGSTAPLFCAGNSIGGNLEVVGNSGSALMFKNSVGGNMSVLDNAGPVDVVGNTVRGNLLCQNNSDLIMGGGNTARKKTGQCN